jgi:hypothetical protein
MPMYDVSDNKIRGLKSVNRMNVIEDELSVSMWQNVRTVPGVSRKIKDLPSDDPSQIPHEENVLHVHAPQQLLQVSFADRVETDDGKVVYNYKQPHQTTAPFYKKENIKASMIDTLDGNELISVSDYSWECFAVSPSYRVSGGGGAYIKPEISYKNTISTDGTIRNNLNPKIYMLEENRINYLRDSNVIKENGTLDTSVSILDPPTENEVFMGIEFQVTPDFDFSTNRVYIIDSFKCPRYTEVYSEDNSIAEMFRETVDVESIEFDPKSFSSSDPFSLQSRCYGDTYNTWSVNTKVDPKTRLLIDESKHISDSQKIIEGDSNNTELLIGPRNTYKKISTSRLLYHSSANINHWYNAMRHYYEVNNVFGTFGNLKELITKILSVTTNSRLGGGAETGMNDYYELAKDEYGKEIGLTHQQIVLKWWLLHRDRLSWIDVLSMILPILDPSKMSPHLNQQDTNIGNSLHYSATTSVPPHTLSRTITDEYGYYEGNSSGKTLTQIIGLTDLEVNGYTKDNYMVKMSSSNAQAANHTNPDNTYVSNTNQWIYEKDRGLLPRISYLVNIYLQFNKSEIPRVLSCVAEGVSELIKTEFNKYSPLFYQKLDNGDYVPHSNDNITGKVYFTK